MAAVLTDLNVSSNPSFEGEAARQLASAALASPSLAVLSGVPITELREDKRSELELGGKGLGDTEAIVLGELLKGSKALTSLNLSCACRSHAAAPAAAHARVDLLIVTK